MPAPLAEAAPAAPRRGLALMMVERPGCPWCAAWRREILPSYAAQAAGRRLPLSFVSLDGPWPDGLALARAPRVTPTFLLLRGGIEIARIEGYAGPARFWPEIDSLLPRG
ncbi:hypothetical protein B0A89_08225 [Paracoccus contaminans]|uniref:SoxS protein n=1 Tax=Paracoccus contaminans TaxID=1945662 RepID=A0A1W6D107_9RHOB|nr:hypothetical protein B0A89_08225 [Paracoccus contaminans]